MPSHHAGGSHPPPDYARRLTGGLSPRKKKRGERPADAAVSARIEAAESSVPLELLAGVLQAEMPGLRHGYGRARDAGAPTDALPLSDAKILVMQGRASRGEGLFHPGDRCDIAALEEAEARRSLVEMEAEKARRRRERNGQE